MSFLVDMLIPILAGCLCYYIITCIFDHQNSMYSDHNNVGVNTRGVSSINVPIVDYSTASQVEIHPTDSHVIVSPIAFSTDQHLVALPRVMSTPVFQSRGEIECGRLLHEFFPGHVFINNFRPDWNRNDYSGENLELDWFNEALKLAAEFNGRGHYEEVDFTDKQKELTSIDKSASRKRLYGIQQRDKRKKSNCERRSKIYGGSVSLVIVPYWEEHRMRHFLLQNPTITCKMTMDNYLHQLKLC